MHNEVSKCEEIMDKVEVRKVMDPAERMPWQGSSGICYDANTTTWACD